MLMKDIARNQETANGSQVLGIGVIPKDVVEIAGVPPNGDLI